MRQSIVICAMVAGLAVMARPAPAQQLQLPEMTQLSTGAIDVVDVSVDQALLGLAASFMSNGTDDKEVKALIGSLKGIYVKSFTYGKDGAYDPAVLGTNDMRSISADPAAARNWYQKPAALGSVEARRRLTQIQN